MSDWFHKLAAHASKLFGSAWAFVAAALTIIFWGASGPLFHFSDTWQLVINTSTTIVTFLMVFVIQNSQNRDSRAIHLKLDELLRAMKHARDQLVHVEDLSEAQLREMEQSFDEIGRGPAVPVPKISGSR